MAKKKSGKKVGITIFVSIIFVAILFYMINTGGVSVLPFLPKTVPLFDVTCTSNIYFPILGGVNINEKCTSIPSNSCFGILPQSITGISGNVQLLLGGKSGTSSFDAGFLSKAIGGNSLIDVTAKCVTAGQQTGQIKVFDDSQNLLGVKTIFVTVG